MKKQLLIFIDRDGTILYDRKKSPRYYLGRQKDWKAKTKFLNGVVRGLKLLKKKGSRSKNLSYFQSTWNCNKRFSSFN